MTSAESSRTINPYKPFNNYLKRQLLHLNYIPTSSDKTNFSSTLQVISWLSLVIYALITFKTGSLLFLEPSNVHLFYKLAGPTVAVGSIFHTEFTLILLLWMNGTIYCALFIKYSQYSRKYQSWITTFVNLSSNRQLDPLVRLIKKSFLLQTQIVTGFSVGAISFFHILYLNSCPYDLLAYCFVNYLGNMFAAFITAVYLGSTGCMFTFNCMITGLTFHRFSIEAKEMVKRFNVHNGQQQKSKSDHSIGIYLDQVIRQFQQLIDTRAFWEHVNSTIFFATYMVQSVLLYLLFFVNIPYLMKFAISLMVIVNFLGGQSVHFLAGHVAKIQVEKNLFQLNRLMFTRTSFLSKIKILNTLEHFKGRKINTIFSSIEYSLASLILVTLENAVLFMLMIVNYDRLSANV